MPKVVVATSPTDVAGAKAANTAVSDDWTGAETTSPAKTACVEAATKAAAVEAATTETATTKATATVAAAPTASSECHVWRGQSRGGNGQQHH